MIDFVCDTCGAVKQADESWIVGLAAEAVGAASARREVNIQSAWTREASLHPFAVHFCSIQCKDEYMGRLFGTSPWNKSWSSVPLRQKWWLSAKYRRKLLHARGEFGGISAKRELCRFAEA